jgi:hypothetical protein
LIEDKHMKRSLFTRKAFIGVMIPYCLWALHDMAHTEVFSLWCISPRSNGGLSFTTVDVGNVLSISGTLNPKTPHPKPYVRLTPTSCNELSVHQHPIHHAFTGLH